MIWLMVLVLNCTVHFPAHRDRESLIIRDVAKIGITENSLKSFTGKAYIDLAASPFYKGSRVTIESLIQAGDPVDIYLRYDRHSQDTEFVDEDREFAGFVKQVSPQNPIRIECEDYSYLLKNKQIEKAVSMRKGTLKDLLSKILPKDIAFESVDAPIGNYVCKQKTVAQVLDDLKKDYGIVSHFKDRTLYVGEIYTSNPTQEPIAVYRFGQNVKKDSLTYENRDQNPLVIVRSKIKGEKKPIEVKKGQEGGKQHVVKLEGITDRKLLQDIADRRYELLTRKVLKGSITGFGYPVLKPGDIVRLDNARFEGMDGKSFFIDDVKQEFGPNGWERVVQLGKQLYV